jgi:hypothetical protein
MEVMCGLYNLFYSANIIKIIKFRMRWAGHVTCMQVIKMTKEFYSENEAENRVQL